MLSNFSNISEAINFSRERLKNYGQTVKTESWQGIKQEREMFEFLNLYWSAPIPNDLLTLRNQIKPDLPWADKHFEERVGGEPSNPGETYKIWPYYKNTDFNDKNFRNVSFEPGYDKGKMVQVSMVPKKETKFTHTYMERYWPKHAAPEVHSKKAYPLFGIRYYWGDLADVINLLNKEPYTRQAYLPIWFPEDTGVLHGGRVPCSLGYHFIMRNNKLNIHYTIRACDFIRHFRNDIYLTCRLAQWVLHKLMGDTLEHTLWDNVSPGLITMDIISLHVFDQEKNLI